jgi:hypothetical protein
MPRRKRQHQDAFEEDPDAIFTAEQEDRIQNFLDEERELEDVDEEPSENVQVSFYSILLLVLRIDVCYPLACTRAAIGNSEIQETSPAAPGRS